MTELCVHEIEECARVQVRKMASLEAVQRYRDAYEAGEILPPMVVFREAGTDRYIVSDGHHRLKALKAAEIDHIDVDLREGDEVAALEHALGANADHGLPRKSSDILFAVGQLMTTPALTQKYRTHAERAELLKVSERTFQRYLADWREKEGGNRTEREAKQAANASARRHDPRKGWGEPDTCHVPRGSVELRERPSRQPRHDFKGQDAANLRDLEHSTYRLATFPMSGRDAAQKYRKVQGFSIDYVRRAKQFLADFEKEWDR